MAKNTKVIASRIVTAGTQVRRRRQCNHCQQRFTSYETVVLTMPHIIKNDGSREVFDEQKLRIGLMKSLEKRPVNTEKIEELLTAIKQYIRSIGDREISSNIIGLQVMKYLRDLDEVAYVRFASVYRKFKDIQEFQATLDTLQK